MKIADTSRDMVVDGMIIFTMIL